MILQKTTFHKFQYSNSFKSLLKLQDQTFKVPDSIHMTSLVDDTPPLPQEKSSSQAKF